MKITIQFPKWVWPFSIYERLRFLERANAKLNEELWGRGMKEMLMAPAYMVAIDAAFNSANEMVANERKRTEALKQQIEFLQRALEAERLANRPKGDVVAVRPG